MNHIECNKFSCALCSEIHNIERMLNIFVKSSNGKMYILDSDGRGMTGCSLNATRALCYLCNNAGTLVTKSDIEGYVWRGAAIGISSLPVLIHEVRTLLKATDFEIVTIRNRGFVFHNSKQTGIPVQRDITVRQVC